MIQSINEKQFIRLFSEQRYHRLIANLFIKMKESAEYKNASELCAGLIALSITDLSGREWTLIIECTARKVFKERINAEEASCDASLVDFGISNMHLSDEEMPDFALDMYNEYQKSKQK